MKGTVIIQTYQPEHYAIECSKNQDYASFYEYEMSYRKLLNYPPVVKLLAIVISSDDEKVLNDVTEDISKYIHGLEMVSSITGPAQASIYRINNIYRKVLYLKDESAEALSNITELCDKRFYELSQKVDEKTVLDIQYDLNPMRIL